MSELKLFTDGSVNPQLKMGFGAYLLVAEEGVCLDALEKSVKVKRFEQTSSTALELQTLLWALSDFLPRAPRSLSIPIARISSACKEGVKSLKKMTISQKTTNVLDILSSTRSFTG